VTNAGTVDVECPVVALGAAAPGSSASGGAMMHNHHMMQMDIFPATLATDDPCVADEMSLPTVAWSKTGDVPPAKELDISGEISKRITQDFGVSIGNGWTQIRQPGSPTISGFGNLETAFQYQLLKDPTHETSPC
jgi:hypothetical protein